MTNGTNYYRIAFDGVASLFGGLISEQKNQIFERRGAACTDSYDNRGGEILPLAFSEPEVGNYRFKSGSWLLKERRCI